MFTSTIANKNNHTNVNRRVLNENFNHLQNTRNQNSLLRNSNLHNQNLMSLDNIESNNSFIQMHPNSGQQISDLINNVSQQISYDRPTLHPILQNSRSTTLNVQDEDAVLPNPEIINETEGGTTYQVENL